MHGNWHVICRHDIRHITLSNNTHIWFAQQPTCRSSSAHPRIRTRGACAPLHSQHLWLPTVLPATGLGGRCASMTHLAAPEQPQPAPACSRFGSINQSAHSNLRETRWRDGSISMHLTRHINKNTDCDNGSCRFKFKEQASQGRKWRQTLTADTQAYRAASRSCRSPCAC